MIKRFLRIAPLYYAAIPCYLILDWIGNYLRARANKPPEAVFGAGAVLCNVLFIHSWTPLGNNDVVPGGWSIGVEMMFYLIAPLCFAALNRRKIAWFAFPAVVAIGLGITNLLAGGHVRNNSFYYYWFPTEFPTILCGLVLCQIGRAWLLTRGALPAKATLLACLIGPPAFLLAAMSGAIMNWNNGIAPLLFGVAFACLMVLARGPLSPMFANRAAVWVGRLSYSVYIVHFAVLSILHLLDLKLGLFHSFPDAQKLVVIVITALAVTLGLASLTRRWIEEPGIHLGRQLASRSIRPRATAYETAN
jgi:peptidoglycan/LPS O-acetylase OafA/YrhL